MGSTVNAMSTGSSLQPHLWTSLTLRELMTTTVELRRRSRLPLRLNRSNLTNLFLVLVSYLYCGNVCCENKLFLTQNKRLLYQKKKKKKKFLKKKKKKKKKKKS